MPRGQIPFTKHPARGSHDDLSSPRRGRPFLFQVVAPNSTEPLYPYMLALHSNPSSVEERMQHGKVVAMTYGGFIEWHWPEDLDSISCESSTGAFISPEGGLVAGGDRTNPQNTAIGRKGTIAWERQQDLLELFHNNGTVYNNRGQPVLRGRVMMVYDRGVYLGHFTNFNVNEDDQHAYSFQLSWEFKSEQTIYNFPVYDPTEVSTNG